MTENDSEPINHDIPIILHSQNDSTIEEDAPHCDTDSISDDIVEHDLNLMSDDINNSLDDTDYYLAAELLAIKSHRTLNYLVELQV